MYRLLMRGTDEFEVGLLNREGMPIATGSGGDAHQLDAESGIIALLVLIESMAAERSSRRTVICAFFPKLKRYKQTAQRL